MNNELELIVPFKKSVDYSGIVATSLCILLFNFHLFYDDYLPYLVGDKFLFGCKITSLVFLTILLIALLYLLFLNMRKAPAAILNAQGIWLYRFGFIAWNEIKLIEEYTIPAIHVVNIGIHVNDLKMLSKQATVGGKLTILYSKLFGYPPITLSSADLENEQIIIFARRFKPESDFNH